MSVHKKWSQLHKWLGLIIGLQILLWVAGGLVMSAIPINLVRGQHLVHHAPALVQMNATSIDMSHWATVSHLWRGQQPLLQLTAFDGSVHYVNAVDGSQVLPLSAEEALGIAQERFIGDAPVNQVKWVAQLPLEVSHLNQPLYQISFSDWINTTLYIHPVSGELLSVRSDIWRFYDFFWMLHIMDYDNRSDFNHPLLIIAALLALLGTSSGIGLLYWRLFKPWLTRRKRQTE